MISSIGAQIQIYSAAGTTNRGNYKDHQVTEITPQSNTAAKDTVSISSEGKQLSQTNSNSNNLPLEAYSIPSWMGDYHPEVTTLSSSEINHDYWTFLSELESENLSRDEKRQQITNYLDNDSTHLKMLANDSFARKYDAELSEYTTKLETYFQDSLKESGIETSLDYYQNVVLNNENSEKIHENVRERLAGDSRLMDLMDLFGIQL